MLIYNTPAAPAVPPIVPPKANRKRPHSTASSTSGLTPEQQQDMSTQHKRAVVACCEVEKRVVTVEKLKVKLAREEALLSKATAEMAAAIRQSDTYWAMENTA